ncbi:MAG: hypothetical protein K2I73_05240 [Eubacterium sp.]|nr:hypothetical protein [Eubacterium sp.]
MKKTISIISCCLMICLLFIGCSTNNTESKEVAIIKNDLKSYFSCYEKGDFEGMKKFCTKNYVDEYFHDGDVFGNLTAKLVDFEEIKYDETAMKYTALVQIECMPTKISALYNRDKPDEPVNTYMDLVVSVDNGNAVIEAFAY